MWKSSTTTDEREGVKLPPVHPGEFLREDFLVPLSMSAADLAAACGASVEVLEAVIAERAPVTGELALRWGAISGAPPTCG